MGTVKPGIESIKLLGKDHHIPIIRLRDEGDPFHLTEVLRLGQGDPYSISRVGAVGDDVLPFQSGHAWILHAELFIGGKRAIPRRNQKGLWIGGEVESVGTACQTNDGPSRAEMGAEQHDVCVLMLHHRRVVNGFHWVGDLRLGKDGVVAISSDNVRPHDCLFASRSKIVEYTRSYASTMVVIEKHCWTRWRQALRSMSARRARARAASLTLLTRNPVCPSLITSRQEPRSMAITGTPAALASDRTSPNRSGMVFRWIKVQALANNLFFSAMPTGPI